MYNGSGDRFMPAIMRGCGLGTLKSSRVLVVGFQPDFTVAIDHQPGTQLATAVESPKSGEPHKHAPAKPNDPEAPANKYAILVTGHCPEDLEAEFGDSGQQFKALLEDEDENEEWHVFYPVDGHMPTDEDLLEYKGIIVTGSRHDSFATDAWNMQLRSLLKNAYDRQQRILGVCFGDQLMSIVLGGKVGRSQYGFEGGARTIKTTPAFHDQWFAEGYLEGWSFTLHETHNDRITEVPDAVTVLGYTDQTPMQMCCSGDHFLGLQGHPEMTEEFMFKDLRERTDTGALLKDVGENALKELEANKVTPEQRAEVQKFIKRFLKQYHPAAKVYK